MKELRGKKALITGAASGIGRAIALALAREQVELVLLDVDAARLADVCKEAKAAGVATESVHCDLSQPEEISAAVNAVSHECGAVDILVNNAGVAYYGPTERMTADQWNWLLQVNLLAPIQLTRQLLPILLGQPEAHILNVCSIAGLVAGRKLAAYHVSKFGLVGFGEALRAEFRCRGLGVTTLCPGFVRTRIFDCAAYGKKDQPVKKPPKILTITPECVARRAVQAIRRNRGLVLVSPMAQFLWSFKRLSPRLLEWVSQFHRTKRRAPRVHMNSTSPELFPASQPEQSLIAANLEQRPPSSAA